MVVGIAAVVSVQAAFVFSGGLGVLMKYRPLENITMVTMWLGLVFVWMTVAC